MSNVDVSNNKKMKKKKKTIKVKGQTTMKKADHFLQGYLLHQMPNKNK